MKIRFFLFPVVFLLYLSISAQFSPLVGFPGSTAIFKDSAVFAGWASSCNLVLGWQNISDTTLGIANAGTAASAVGKAGENGTASLGDGGYATLSFDAPIYNGQGADFAVFENAFIDSFLEFAFVEVSSDGQRFVRFPAISNIQDTLQTASFGLSDCSLVYNLAGTFRANYGTPFDLDELKDSAGLDLDNIRYVRIRDVIGSIDSQYATFDSYGKKINDPWPTDFPSSGFDLDAVGAIHQKPLGLEEYSHSELLIYPNPTNRYLYFQQQCSEINIFDLSGGCVFEGNDQQIVDVASLRCGIYFTKVKSGKVFYFSRFIKTD